MMQSCDSSQIKNIIIKIKNFIKRDGQSEALFYALFIFIKFIYKKIGKVNLSNSLNKQEKNFRNKNISKE